MTRGVVVSVPIQPKGHANREIRHMQLIAAAERNLPSMTTASPVQLPPAPGAIQELIQALTRRDFAAPGRILVHRAPVVPASTVCHCASRTSKLNAFLIDHERG